MSNTKTEWTSAANLRRSKSGLFSPEERAWKLMSSSAKAAGMTHVELQALRRLADARRRASSRKRPAANSAETSG
jgi:hypothetical protein